MARGKRMATNPRPDWADSMTVDPVYAIIERHKALSTSYGAACEDGANTEYDAAVERALEALIDGADSGQCAAATMGSFFGAGLRSRAQFQPLSSWGKFETPVCIAQKNKTLTRNHKIAFRFYSKRQPLPRLE
jgi:hypothetical protein